MGETNNEQIWKLFIFVLGLLASGAFSLATWTALGVIENGNSLSSVTSSRCTAKDCSSIRESLADLRAQVSVIPKQVPPKWFLDKVNQLDLRLTSEMSAIERRVSELEKHQWDNVKGVKHIK